MMVTLANEFAERGYRVDLVLTQAEGPYMSEVAHNVRVVDLGKSRVLTSLLPLAGYLRRERPDAMLSALNHANVIAILARYLSRTHVRLLVSERANFSVSSANMKPLQAALRRTIIANAYPQADGIIAVSEGVADDLAKSTGLDRATISVVYNPVVTQELLRKSRKTPSHPWFVAGEPPVIIAAGRLAKQKDFSTLLKAFSIVRQKRIARLVILGEGELKHELNNLANVLGIQSDIDFPGFVENPFSYLSRSSLFVLSSGWEGLPNVLIQAMACGVPVVSTDCPSGPREILADGQWGRLVEVGNAEEMAQAMAETLEKRHHPDVASRASEFSADRAVSGFLSHIFQSDSVEGATDAK